jgi:GxxExxY protein
MTENEISNKIIGIAIIVHTELGPGLLESAYESCLFYALQKNGLTAERQKILPLIFQEIRIDAGYRLDLLVENKVIVEIKAIESFNDVHLAQLLTYLKLSGCKLGLLINFNVRSLKNGIRRVVNHL